jgi:hypothetical protein
MGKFANPSILIAAGLIFGLLIAGAWPRQTPMPDGGPSSPFLYAVSQWQTLIAGVLALLAAIYAARRAWRSVQDQIRADKVNTAGQIDAIHDQINADAAAARHERKRRQFAAVTTASLDLRAVRYAWTMPLKEAAPHVSDEVVSLRLLLRDVLDVDPRIGHALGTFLYGARGVLFRLEGNGIPDPVAEAGTPFMRRMRKMAPYADLIDTALTRTANELGDGMPVPKTLIDAADIAKTEKEYRYQFADDDEFILTTLRRPKSGILDDA